MSLGREVAHWQTKGKDYLTLYHTEYGYSYRGHGCGGTFPCGSDADAIAYMEAHAVAVLKSDRTSLKRLY